MLFSFELTALGLGVGFLATLAGVGGGVILTPLLLLFFPDRPAGAIAAASLFVVALNTLSGSLAYHRLGQIDHKTAAAYGTAALPGIVLGSLGTSYVPRGAFDLLLGVVLLVLSAAILQPSARAASRRLGGDEASFLPRRIVDRAGRVFEYQFRYRAGIWMCAGVASLAGFLGIGGGSIYVPLMIRFLRIPPHIATATSQGLLLITSSAAVLVHFLQGNLNHDLIAPLALGVVGGAQCGAVASGRLRPAALTRVLAGLLVLVSAKVLLQGMKALLG
ncbi:MAG: sulfite exporter TauE/SafE family protein [Nitrospinota bacterium]